MLKVFEDGQLPTRGSKYSACVDLYAREDVVIHSGETKLIPLGVCLIDLEYQIPDDKYRDTFMKNHYLQLMLRSSLSKHLIIANGVGVIDMDYKGEIMIRVYNHDFTNRFTVKKGTRVAQITMLEHKGYFGIDTEDERDGGFGSTGER